MKRLVYSVLGLERNSISAILIGSQMVQSVLTPRVKVEAEIQYKNIKTLSSVALLLGQPEITCWIYATIIFHRIQYHHLLAIQDIFVLLDKVGTS